jgi:hypothetical protein
MAHVPAVSVCLTCGVRCAGDILKGYWEWWHLSVEEIGHDPQPDPAQVVPYLDYKKEHHG